MSGICESCGHALAPGGKRWSILLPLEPPSQNDPVSANRGGARFEYGRLRLHYQILLQNSRAALGIPVAKKKRRVTITRIYSKHGRRRDRGNLVGGCKMVLDAMTRAGLIVDDREEYVEDHYRQERGDAPGVRIEIEELGGVAR